MWKTTVIVLLVLLLLGGCCCCLLGIGGGIFYFAAQEEDFSWQGEWQWDLEAGDPTVTPVVIRPTPEPTPEAAATESSSNNGTKQEGEVVAPQPQSENQAWDTLQTLENVHVPENDLLDIAERLEGKENIPRTLEAPPAPLEVGAKDVFWVTNVDSNESFQVDATLRYVTDHAYFWIENDVGYDENELEVMAETFEYEIYPTTRAFFGSEWNPGVDGDPHIYILYVGGLGYGLAGYFSSVDSYHPLAHEYSNAHETFVFNADTVDLDEEYTLGVLAHEFQHMIHWHRDRNETSWLNEGFSELAAFLNGYDAGGFDYLYTSNSDLQLNDWPNDPNATGPHYGAAFLFTTYFLDRFGDEATKALVGHPDNGMSSVDTVLAELNVTDPLTNQSVSGDDVFFDWTLASYLLDGDIADGRYTYHNYADAPRAYATETISSCPTETLTRDVSQYGVDYIRITCAGNYTLNFEGSVQVGVLPADPYSGDYAFWSNKGDESNMTLTRHFDFRDHSGPLTLSYWTWYDIEEDYDYVYVEASLNGEDWQILTTPSGTLEDPSGNSYGWAYNGQSGGTGRWIQEQVDLSEFAGEQVQIRFEYITDAAVNGEGFLLDDITVPETGYASDFEADSGGWEAAGFVRIQNKLPQTFRLALITQGESPAVTMLSLSADNLGEYTLSLDGREEAVLVVAGTTRYTRQKAAYRFEIVP